MDNPKIITVLKGTEVNISGIMGTAKTTHTQNCLVISETESHFFYKNEKGNTISVWKSKIKKLTYKYRTLDFEDLKKDEMLNIIDNYHKIVILAQKMSKLISKYEIDQHDMSIYDAEDIRTGITESHFVLYKEHILNGKIKDFSCKVPKKFLWDHSWRKNLKHELESKGY